MALELKGTYSVAIERARVWLLLNDPAVLTAIIPGCESLTPTGPDRYALGLKLLVGSVKGNYSGTVALSAKQPPDFYTLELIGEGSIGFVKGAARFDLAPEAGGGTQIAYDGTAEVGGLVAGVGNRVLGGVAKFMIKRFFNAFTKYLKDHAEQVAALDISNLNPQPPQDAPTAPAAAGNAAQQAVRIGDVALQVRLQGTAGKPWLVMAHAIATDLGVWDQQLALLQERFRILRYNIRGHGGSEVGSRPVTLAQLADDVIGLFDHFDIERAHFAGVSLGGMIGFRLAAAHAARVLSLTAVDARADAPPAFQAGWEERIAAARGAGMEVLVAPTLERWFGSDASAEQAEAQARVGEMIRHTSAEGFAACARALQQLDLLQDMRHIVAPTLLVAGSRDATIPADMQHIRTLIGNASYKQIEAAGHLPNVEQPAAFNEVLDTFLREQTST